MGKAVKVTVGFGVDGGAVTVRVALLLIVAPPEPEQRSAYVVLTDGETVNEPLVGLVPNQPPEAVQVVTLVPSHERSEENPD